MDLVDVEVSVAPSLRKLCIQAIAHNQVSFDIGCLPEELSNRVISKNKNSKLKYQGISIEALVGKPTDKENRCLNLLLLNICQPAQRSKDTEIDIRQMQIILASGNLMTIVDPDFGWPVELFPMAISNKSFLFPLLHLIAGYKNSCEAANYCWNMAPT